MRRIRRTVILGTAALGLVMPGVAWTTVTGASASTVPPAAPAPCPAWDGVQPTTGNLNDVAMAGCDVWAVGYTGFAPATSAESWSGADWTAQLTPAEPGPSQLFGVAATSAGNAWAVGYVGTHRTSRSFRTLILRWDGQSWTQVPSPQGNPAGFNQLNAVAVTSAGDAWAVGTYNDGAALQTLILHWNGQTWKRQPSPDPGGGSRFNTLTAVAATSATSAWALGSARIRTSTGLLFVRSFLLHWNGQKWARVSDGLDQSRDIGLTSVTATSASNAWAVGSEGSLGQIERTVIVHWNGHAWKRQPTPNRIGPRPGHPSNYLDGVTATAAANAWAVGWFHNSSGAQTTLILHWNGRTWRWVASPNLPSGLLSAVAATSADSAWAIGGGMVLHWNGTSWQL